MTLFVSIASYLFPMSTLLFFGFQLFVGAIVPCSRSSTFDFVSYSLIEGARYDQSMLQLPSSKLCPLICGDKFET